MSGPPSSSPLMALADEKSAAPVIVAAPSTKSLEPRCVGCGLERHGSVGAGIACLEREVIKLRKALRERS